MTLKGPVEASRLEQSLNALIQTYDIFRTVFDYSSFKNPVQIVLKERRLPLQYEDISGLDHRSREEHLERLKVSDRNQGFNLTSDALLRFKLLKWEDEEYKLLWSHHHILMDGWCIGIILKDLLQHYSSASASGSSASPQQPAPYSSYVKWLQQQNDQAAKQHWGSYLRGYKGRTGIPLQKAGKSADYAFAQVTYEIGEDLTGRLAELAQAAQVTMSSAFQTVWGILLQKYNNTEDAVFGSVISGRSAPVPGIDEMVGLFINTIPVRVKGEDGSTILELMAGIQRHMLESEQYSYVSLPEMMEPVSAQGGGIDHVLVFENYPLDLQELQAQARCPFEIAGIEAFEQTNYDLDLTVYPGERLKIVFTFNEHMYSNSFLSSIGMHLEQIIQQVTSSPSMHIRDIELLPEEERKRILRKFNSQGRSEEGRQKETVIGRFEEQVRLYPDQTAVMMGDEKYTYAELNRQVLVLARRLQKLGIRRGDYVGLRLERSVQMVIAMLAVLKAGAAYVPIMPEEPVERVNAMLHYSSSEYVISSRELAPLPGIQAGMLWMEETEGEGLAAAAQQLEPASVPGDADSVPEDPAYIVFQ